MNAAFTTSFLVDETPEEVFKAINNVRGWWSEMLEGETENPGDEFIYRHKDIHYSKQKLIEVIPGKKVVWLVTDSHLSFTKNREEWTGTTICFDISQEVAKTKITFTHIGLSSGVECFDACSNAWSHYLHNSLLQLISTGKGRPDLEEKKVKQKSNAD